MHATGPCTLVKGEGWRALRLPYATGAPDGAGAGAGVSLSTVYANLGRTSVGEGDAVRVGSLLGTVGNTGAGGEYSLHFEVRQGGTAKDPMNYLRRL